MSFTLRRAVRSGVQLIIGLAGGTGSGKTYTAMRIAAGIAGGKPFAVIDTERGRAKHYADMFVFDHGDLEPPFTPERYSEAIETADKAGYPVIVVDQMSHEHAGEGGLLDMQDDEIERMAKDDLAKRDRVKRTAWIMPKREHKKMMQKLLRVNAHLILCFRAEEKTDQVKNQQTGQWEFVPKKSLVGLDGWIPIAEKTLPFECTASFLFTADKPGIPKKIKLQEQHKAIFPLDKEITEDAGRRIAEWAAGTKETVATQTPASASSGAGGTPAAAAVLTPKQVADLETMCIDAGLSIAALKKAAGVAELNQVDYERAKTWIKNKSQS